MTLLAVHPSTSVRIRRASEISSPPTTSGGARRRTFGPAVRHDEPGVEGGVGDGLRRPVEDGAEQQPGSAHGRHAGQRLEP